MISNGYFDTNMQTFFLVQILTFWSISTRFLDLLKKEMHHGSSRIRCIATSALSNNNSIQQQNFVFCKMAGREDAAKHYLNQHRIPELLQNVTSALVYARPDYPRQYMIDFLKKLQEAKAVKMDYPCIFDESNVVSLFGIMDPSSKGYISFEQYKTAMDNLGVTDFNSDPPGADIDKITLDVFINEAKEGISNASSTFKS